MTRKIAVIDIGSNSFRLVIYHVKQGRFYEEAKNFKVTARLQTFLNDQQILNDEGVKVLLNTLTDFKEIIEANHVSEVVLAATATLRQSRNHDEILNLISDKLGLKVDLLSGEREAYYGLLSVIHSTYLESGITIDIGGGSTEITLFKNRKMIHSISLPFGALSLTKMFVENCVPTMEELNKLNDFLSAHLKELVWLKNCRLPVIGIGGSARTVAKIHKEVNNYPLSTIHLYEMDVYDLDSISAHLQSLSYDSLQQVPGLSKDRADLIIPAIQVFTVVARMVEAPFFQVSLKGIRDGILLEQLAVNENEPVDSNQLIEKNFLKLCLDYSVDLNARVRVAKTALLIAKAMNSKGIAEISKEDMKDLQFSSYVYKIGSYIDSRFAHNHTFYILSNQSMDGLPHQKQVKMALIASYQSKNSFKQTRKLFKDWFTKEEKDKIKLLAAILKFAYAVNDTNRNIIKSIDLEKNNEGIKIVIHCGDENWFVEQLLAEAQLKHLENALKKKWSMEFKLLNRMI
ncbi:hypothetical protein WQ57_01285 [Mesobacillus campisalis]|uniref:Uncharacterized protein n=1 Tax=Mesobacillus campisalis TaxID=1408103 RepID=A0A0M2SZE9_9BACI|nr:Ppx/GppA family phosphatase [Mesobacillus campisalis]KKK39934.1 hypothetical protein WQ57_01285 [Mesobacillus campisalis]